MAIGYAERSKGSTQCAVSPAGVVCGAHSRAGSVIGKVGVRNDRRTREEHLLVLSRRIQRARRRRNWAVVARASRAAIERDPANPEWHLSLGLALGATGDFAAAARAYEAAIQRAPDAIDPYLRLAAVHRKAKDWDAAAHAYDRAIERDPKNPSLHFKRAEMRGRVHGYDQAAESIRAGLDLDPDTASIDYELLALKAWHFEPRRAISRFVRDALPQIAAGAAGDVQPEHPPKVYVYWGQGFADAPPMVKMCEHQLRALNPPEDVVFLDDALATRLAGIPQTVEQKIMHHKRKYSDVLRMALLSRYGGVWMDATCLTRARVLDVVPQILRSDFFAFEYGNARICSWFLASTQGSYITTMMREALYAYWMHHDRAVDYYVLHHLFESLYLHDDRFRDEWSHASALPKGAAVALKNSMHKPFQETVLRRLLKRSFVHKLTFKRAAPSGSIHEYLTEHGPPDPADESPWNIERVGRPSIDPQAVPR